VPVALGRAVTPRMLEAAARAREAIAAELDTALSRDGVDAIVTPTTDGTARPYSAAALAGEELDDERFQARVAFTIVANLAGLPAVSVPCGLDARGLPVGLQLIGRRGADARLLAIAARLERILRAPSRIDWW
jgi:Asp-tRNA(Asn)/Glu-tRNA(Gln) amidotransferase A subunit family amidase